MNNNICNVSYNSFNRVYNVYSINDIKRES